MHGSASGEVLRGWAFDPAVVEAPDVESRYRLRVRCSSQVEGSGCEDATEAVVLLYPPADVDPIELDTVVCDAAGTGEPAVCDPGDGIALAFARPSQAGGFSGFDLYRADRSGIASPVVAAAACVADGFGGGVAVGEAVTVAESPAFAPAAGEAAFYLVGHRRMPAASPAPAGFARPEGAPVPRFVDPACP